MCPETSLVLRFSLMIGLWLLMLSTRSPVPHHTFSSLMWSIFLTRKTGGVCILKFGTNTTFNTTHWTLLPVDEMFEFLDCSLDGSQHLGVSC